MEIFGDIERFLSEDLYSYRWPITIGVAVAVFAGFLLAFRLGWQRAVRRHPAASAAILLATMAVVVPAGWYLLSPLWERSYLEEASPLEAAEMAANTPAIADTPPVAPTGSPLPRLTYAGMFMGADDFHFWRGDAQLIETAPGVYTLRFENFSVRNGPDLYVYLTPDASASRSTGRSTSARSRRRTAPSTTTSRPGPTLRSSRAPSCGAASSRRCSPLRS